MKLISVFQSKSVPVPTIPFTVFAPAGIWGSAPLLTIPFTVFAPAGMWGSAPVLTIPFTVFAPAGMWSVPAVLEWGPYSWSELLQSPHKYLLPCKQVPGRLNRGINHGGSRIKLFLFPWRGYGDQPLHVKKQCM